MAAAYAFHIAQNQPLLDGNKRTGLLAPPLAQGRAPGTPVAAGRRRLLLGAGHPARAEP